MKEYLLYFPTKDTDWKKVLAPFLGLKYRTTSSDHVMVECEPTVLAAIKAAHPNMQSEELL